MVLQYQPHCTVTWAILRGEMGEITVQNGCNWNARCKSLVINTSDVTSCANACRDARLVRPLKTPRAFVSTTTLFVCHSPCADARINVY